MWINFVTVGFVTREMTVFSWSTVNWTHRRDNMRHQKFLVLTWRYSLCCYDKSSLRNGKIAHFLKASRSLAFDICQGLPAVERHVRNWTETSKSIPQELLTSWLDGIRCLSPLNGMEYELEAERHIGNAVITQFPQRTNHKWPLSHRHWVV